LAAEVFKRKREEHRLQQKGLFGKAAKKGQPPMQHAFATSSSNFCLAGSFSNQFLWSRMLSRGAAYMSRGSLEYFEAP
jgi:hypothetical protein